MAEEAVDKRVTMEAGIDTPEGAREQAIQRLKQKQDFKGILAGGIFAIVVTIVIWALGEGGYFWPVWVCLGVAIGGRRPGLEGLRPEQPDHRGRRPARDGKGLAAV